jgi:hypothetical protein
LYNWCGKKSKRSKINNILYANAGSNGQAFELAGLMKHAEVTNQNGEHIDVLFTLGTSEHHTPRPLNALD